MSFQDLVLREDRHVEKSKNIKRISGNGEEKLKFAEGDGWKACHDEERGLYTAESFCAGYYGRESLDCAMALQELISMGRHLYKSVSDRNSSYDIALDEDYASLCPWADVQKTGELWSTELTDLAVALFDSEKQNREQRHRKRNIQESDT